MEKPTKTVGRIGASPSAVATVRRAPAIRLESNHTRKRYLKMLVYGDYGVGKTYLAGTSVEVPSMRDVLMINAEAGDFTLDSGDDQFKNIDIITVKDYSQVSKVYDELKLHCKYRDENNVEKLRELEAKLRGISPEEIKEPKKFYTVIVDSLTEVEQLCMNQLLGITDAVTLDEEVAAAEWKEYRQNHSMIQRLVRNFRNLPMHVIMTCARQYVQDENKKFNYTPAMTGKLSSAVVGFMDIVGFLVITSKQGDGDGTIPRRLYVQPVDKFAAKCRISSYKGAFFDNPSISQIMKVAGMAETTP